MTKAISITINGKKMLANDGTVVNRYELLELALQPTVMFKAVDATTPAILLEDDAITLREGTMIEVKLHGTD